MKTRVLAATSALLLVALVALGIGGCGSDVPQGAIATVGDDVVTQKQFDKIISQSKAQSEQEGQPAFPKKGSAEYKEFSARVVEYLVTQEVINQAAAEPETLKAPLEQVLGVDGAEIDKRWGKQAAEYNKPVKVTDEEVKEQVDQLTEAYGGKEEVEKLLEQQGMTWEDLDQVIEEQLVSQRVYERVVAAAKVTDKQVKTYYEKNREQFDQAETRQVRHVLVDTEAQAKEVREQLAADPSDANWKKVAKEYSTDPGSKDNGGDLGDVTPGMMVPSFDEETFALEVDTISKPVKSQFGWHVIEVTKITPAKESTLADVKDEIEQTLLTERQQQLWDDWLKKATEDANVQYADGFDPAQLMKAAAASPEAPAEEELPAEEGATEGEETPAPEESPEAAPSPDE